MPYHVCAAPNCGQASQRSRIPFFRFPTDPIRCKKWLENCRRTDLEIKTPTELHNLYKLCILHFEPAMVCRNSTSRTVLKKDAVPTIFDFTSHPNNPQSWNPKRGGEQTVEELGSAKKQKVEQHTKVKMTKKESIKGSTSRENSEGRKVKMEGRAPLRVPLTSEEKELFKSVFKTLILLEQQDNIAEDQIGWDSSVQSEVSKDTLELSGVSDCFRIIGREELQEVCETCIREEILKELRRSHFFSIIVEKAISVAGEENLPVFVKFVDELDHPRKHFLGFIPCASTAEALAQTLQVTFTDTWGLQMKYCRGQAYLSSEAMCQKMKAVAIKMLELYPNSVCTPCSSRSINVWLARSLPIQCVSKVIDAMEEIALFFSSSSLLQEELDSAISTVYQSNERKAKLLKNTCQTRWTETHDAFDIMLELLGPVLNCLGGLVIKDGNVAEWANQIMTEVKNFNFIMIVMTLRNLLSYTSSFSQNLHGEACDIYFAANSVTDTAESLKKVLGKIGTLHKKWFKEATDLACWLEIEIPRTFNLGSELPATLTFPKEPSNSVEAMEMLEFYFRGSLARPILRWLVHDIKALFSEPHMKAIKWMSLVPSLMAKLKFKMVEEKELLDLYRKDLPCPDKLVDELHCWEMKWKHVPKDQKLPSNIFDTLRISDIESYPNIRTILKILASLPSVRFEDEKFESARIRFTTYLRRMTCERSKSVAFININSDVKNDFESMVEAFVTTYPDKMQLLKRTAEELKKLENQRVVQSTEDLQATQESSDSEMEIVTMKIGEHDDGFCGLVQVKEEPNEAEVRTLEIGEHAEGQSDSKEFLKTLINNIIEIARKDLQEGNSSGNNLNMSSKELAMEWPVASMETQLLPRFQTDKLLDACVSCVREEVLREVRTSLYFSIFIDQAMDIQDKEHLPVFVRFVGESHRVRTELIGFLPGDVDASTMAESLLEMITEKCGLNMKYCRGQAYLCSGTQAIKLKVVTALLLDNYPLAIPTHCSSYALNIWLAKSISVASVCNTLDVVEELFGFFSQSLQLKSQLQDVITSVFVREEEKANQLKKTLCSDWVRRHDAFEIMVLLLGQLVKCLNEIKENKRARWSSSIAMDACGFAKTLSSFEFVVVLVVLKNALSFTTALSEGLQKKPLAALSHVCQVKGLLEMLERMKATMQTLPKDWFGEAVKLSKSLGIKVELPETFSGDRYCKETVKHYYRDALIDPLIGQLIEEFRYLFSDSHVNTLMWLSLVPIVIAENNFIVGMERSSFLYNSDLPDPEKFSTELHCWQIKWNKKNRFIIHPATIWETLLLAFINLYPNVYTLLQILCVLPSTNAESEKDPSGPKRLRAYLRRTASEERSSALAVISVNTDAQLSAAVMADYYLKRYPEDVQPLQTVEHGLQNPGEQGDKSEGPTPQLQIQQEQQPVRLNVETVEKSVQTEILKEEPECQITTLEEDGKEFICFLFKILIQIAGEKIESSDTYGKEKDLLEEIFHNEIEVVAGKSDRGFVRIQLEEMIDICEDCIREETLNEIHGSPFFSILIGKTVVVMEEKQLPVYIRYLSQLKPRVDFLGFVPSNDDAELLAECLCTTVSEKWGLNMENCCGQAYLGAGQMSQKLKAVAAKILDKYPLALYTHSSLYALNVWLALSIPVEGVCQMMETLEAVFSFFDQSPQLQTELCNMISSLLNEKGESSCQLEERFCTQWVEWHDCFKLVVAMLDRIVRCLDKISTSTADTWDALAVEQADVLSSALKDFDFIISLVVLSNVLSFSQSFSKNLQGEPNSVIANMKNLSSVIHSLSNLLVNLDVIHDAWFAEAIKLTNTLGPGVTFSDQFCGQSYPTTKLKETPEMFYRRTLSVPTVKFLIQEIKDLFSESHVNILNCLSLLPSNETPATARSATDRLSAVYINNLPEPGKFFTDCYCWNIRCETTHKKIQPLTSLFEALKFSDLRCYPNIYTLLKIMCTLPSLKIEYENYGCGEKCFQVYLRVIVNDQWCRSPVGLHLHNDVELYLDLMVDTYIRQYPEKVQLIIKNKEELRKLITQTMKDSSEKPLTLVDQHKQVIKQEPMKYTIETFSVQVKEELEDSIKIESENNFLHQQSEELIWQCGPGSCQVSAEFQSSLKRLIASLGTHCRPKEVLDLHENPVREQILRKVQNAHYFSVVTGQVVAVMGEEYLPVFVRSIDETSCSWEKPLGLLSFSNEGEILTCRLHTALIEKWGLNMEYCRGQAFMNSGPVGQKMKNIAAKTLEKYPLALCTPHYSCPLNVYLARSLPLPCVYRVSVIMEEITAFFSGTPYLQAELDKSIISVFQPNEEKVKELKGIFQSRWTEDHNSFEVMVDLFEALVECLCGITDLPESLNYETVAQACRLLSVIRDFDFVITLVVMKNILLFTKNLSKNLHGSLCDVFYAINSLPAVLHSLNEVTKNMELFQGFWFKEASKLANKLGINLEHLGNTSNLPLETQYQQALSVPVIKHVIQEIKILFSSNTVCALKYLKLVPQVLAVTDFSSEVEEMTVIHSKDLPNPESLSAELRCWRMKWYGDKHMALPDSISSTLNVLDINSFPNVHALLKILSVLPVLKLDLLSEVSGLS
ncbi:uncharacterized protein SI:DKEY-250D21.1 isoform X2 [Latimeria chalumnae]|uniref:uncharacterized protein SI:DKEY-250D21.1 isoform X2 n=1 Tax=Latimeria chalumnae TaxID=7897 RepID=UPI0003C12833|nr:PREDICTED: uncharacterized protein LOC102362164 isoform X2 [Latimeria chalumnae]|eukprot:XP_006006171.1 PREDICTED: uncharacterized protein LOC102362164 isoform X2 [Latimeria chalumnae]